MKKDPNVRKYLMSWIGSSRRWMKMHKGRRYAVSCRQLDCEPTKEASWREANEWWKAKLAEITRQNTPLHPLQPLIDQLKQKETWARQHGRTDEADQLAARLERIAALNMADLDPASIADGAHVDHEAGNGHVQLAEMFGIAIPPDLDPEVRDFLFGDKRLWAERLRNSDSVPTRQTLGHHFDQWYDGQKAKVGAGEIAPDRATTNRTMLQNFLRFAGESSPVETITEVSWRNFALFCRTKVSGKEWAPVYAQSVMRVSRSFVRYLWESNTLAALPKNLNSRDFAITVKEQKKVFFTVAELKRQVDSATGQLQLHLLLMANCGFYQSDIADLKQDEVDWQHGIITRKRSKTQDQENAPVVRWQLWPITFALLKQYRAKDSDLVLLARTGKPWVERELRPDGQLHKVDKIMSNYRRVVKKTGIKKPPKCIRKTSANLLESHKDHGRFASYFLGHAAKGIKERHYTDVSDPLFFAALDWLRQQYGF